MIGRKHGPLIALVWLALACVAAAEEAAPSADPHAWSAEWWPQLRVERQDGEHWVRLGGRLLLDGALIHHDEGLRLAPEFGWTDTGEMRQGRLFVEGLFFQRVELKTEVDFAPDEPTLTDAYLGLRGLGPLGTARFGNHKQPFSFEKQMSRKYLVFMERSSSESLQPDLRDIGFSLRSAVLGERLRWVIAGFRDTEPTGRGFPQPANWSLATRATGLPFWADEGRRLVHLGASYNHQLRDAPTFRISSRPESFVAASLVDTGTIEGVESIDRVGLDAVWVHGPVSLQAEWTHDFLDRKAGRGDLDFWGVYVQAGWFPTGEHRRYQRGSGVFGPVIPLEDFAPWKGRWGAVQLGARFSYLDLDDKDIRGGIESNVGLALNWFLLAQLRLSANWIYGHVNGQGDVHVLQARFQIEY
jgi:phosphate-selective porin OprO/OprP